MNKETILLVEDTKSIIDLVNTTLIEKGFSVSIATNGVQALKIAPKLQPNLILLDILMPEMDGYETCRRLKEIEQTKNIPVIFLSALTKTFDKVKAFQLGGVDFISKPVETEELLARVQTHLTISRLQNDLKDANEKLEEKVAQRTTELVEMNMQLEASLNKLAEKTAALSQSEEKYRYITESITDYIFKVFLLNDNTAKTIHSNNCFAVLGYTADEFNASPHLWYDTIYPNDRDLYVSFLHNFLQTRRNDTIEHRIIRKDGHIRWISNTLLANCDENGLLVSYDGIIKDITERKTLEQVILTTAIETEEKERQRFAQELHDGIGPLLSTVKMYIQWVLKPDSKADKIKILEKMQTIINEAHESIRQISFNLSPHILQNFGLLAAINAFTAKVQESQTIAIDIETDTYTSKDLQTETIIYRILTECLTNTIKHAEATKITIIFTENEKKLAIHYTDNGKGFNFDEIKHTGLGLLNMQSRIQSINGKMNLQSTLDRGTEILIEIDK